MGGSSSSSTSQTQTTTTNTTKTLNQNVQGNQAPLFAPTAENGAASITVTDGGAVKQAFEASNQVAKGGADLAIKISSAALDTFDNVNKRSLQLVQDINKQFADNTAKVEAQAFGFADIASRSDGAKSFDTLVKWGSVAASVVAIASYLEAKK